LTKDAGYVDIKLPSTEVRKVPETAYASIGEVSNEENRLVNLGKAGRSRWLGIRPTVRGTAQNPVDHPYGGGDKDKAEDEDELFQFTVSQQERSEVSNSKEIFKQIYCFSPKGWKAKVKNKKLQVAVFCSHA